MKYITMLSIMSILVLSCEKPTIEKEETIKGEYLVVGITGLKETVDSNGNRDTVLTGYDFARISLDFQDGYGTLQVGTIETSFSTFYDNSKCFIDFDNQIKPYTQWLSKFEFVENNNILEIRSLYIGNDVTITLTQI